MPSFSETVAMIFRVEADTSGAKKDLQGFESAVTHQAGAINSSLTKGFEELAGKIGISSEAATGLVQALGPVALAIGGIAVGIGAMAEGTKELLHLAEAAAEYGAQIYQASLKTGVSAESLSAWKVGAAEAGVSFEAVVRASTLLGTAMGQAAAGSEKAQGKLKDLHVTAGDVDGAMKQVFKTIADGKSETEQLALATEIFGKKVGPGLLPWIKETNGELEKQEAHMHKLGVTINDEAAEAAHNFEVTMKDLELQLGFVAKKIGFEVMPVFQRFATWLSNWLSDNQDEIAKWAHAIGVAFTYVANTILFDIDLITALVKLAKTAWEIIAHPLSPEAGLAAADELIAASAKVKADIDAQIEILRTGKTPEGPKHVREARGGTGPGGGDTDAEDAKKAADEAKKKREREREEELSAQSQHYKNLLDEAHKAYEADQKALEESFKKKDITGDEYRDQSLAKDHEYADKAQAIIEESYKTDIQGKVGTQRELVADAQRKAQTSLDKDLAASAATREKAITDASKKGNADQINAAIKHAEDLARIDKRQADTAIQALDLLHNAGLKSEIEYAREMGDLKIRELEDDRKLAQTPEEIQAIDDKIKLQKVQNEIDTNKAIHDARVKGWDDEMAAAEERAKTAVINFSPFEILKDQADDFFNHLAELAGVGATTMETLGNVAGQALGLLENAFNDVAQAIGSVVQQWVLYGNTAPGAMRKALAAALATIAAEATVRAIEAGAAALWFAAWGDYASAAQAAGSAVLWASIAGVSALVGRGIAGNTFADQTSTATGSTAGAGTQGSKSTAGGAYSGQSDQIIETGANGPGTYFVPQQTIVIKDQTGMMGKLLQWEIETNSSVRQLIVETANAS